MKKIKYLLTLFAEGANGAPGAKGRNGGLPHGRTYSVPSHNGHNDLCNNAHHQGDIGGRGGNGGRAGCGGNGGYPGSFIAIETSKLLPSERVRIVNYDHPQTEGGHGSRGTPGKGGQHGDSCYMVTSWRVRDCFICERYTKFQFGMRSTNTFGPDGEVNWMLNCHERAAPALNHLKVSSTSSFDNVRSSFVNSFSDLDISSLILKFKTTTTTTKTSTTSTTTTTTKTTTTTTPITTTIMSNTATIINISTVLPCEVQQYFTLKTDVSKQLK